MKIDLQHRKTEFSGPLTSSRRIFESFGTNFSAHVGSDASRTPTTPKSAKSGYFAAQALGPSLGRGSLFPLRGAQLPLPIAATHPTVWSRVRAEETLLQVTVSPASSELLQQLH